MSWTILVSSGSEHRTRPRVREVVWNRGHDERHLASLNRKNKVRMKIKPTLLVRDADVSLEDLDPFIAAAARVFVPAKPPEDSVLPGNSSGMEGYGPMAYLRVEWQEPGPVEWADIIVWVARFRDLLIASLRERETAGG